MSSAARHDINDFCVWNTNVKDVLYKIQLPTIDAFLPEELHNSRWNLCSCRHVL